MTKPTSSPVPSPKGTRDLYPDQLLRQNYITRLWRDTAIRHGFEEINGPTFEMLELYTRKSGEGIVSELFRFRREGGDADYALRPEFTPTLARMYAAKAASLPSPTKWFSIGPYFRAERPQRGRLREFLQWNVDVLGDTSNTGTADVLACLIDATVSGGLSRSDVKAHLSNREFVVRRLIALGASEGDIPTALSLLDRVQKLPRVEFVQAGREHGLSDRVLANMVHLHKAAGDFTECTGVGSLIHPDPLQDPLPDSGEPGVFFEFEDEDGFEIYFDSMDRNIAEWCRFDASIVRGLAYYTGTVFEVIAEGERAIAGGGRYDNLIELFGGPPTPAVGFGMGDVVLGLLLDDKGLMPTGAELMDALSRPGASLRPEAFVVAGSEDEDALVEPLLANLRRGIERKGFVGKPWSPDRYAVRPMHARRTYKTTRNLKKLLNDAEKQHAKYAIVLHGADKVQVKDLDNREELVHDRGDFSVDPASDAYVGKAIADGLA